VKVRAKAKESVARCQAHRQIEYDSTPLKAWLLQLGMTPAEVEEAIGKPKYPDSEPIFAMRRTYYERVVGTPNGEKRVELWSFPQHTIMVAYDVSCKVQGYIIVFHGSRLLDRLRELVGW
jgi:hypothetical protein